MTIANFFSKFTSETTMQNVTTTFTEEELAKVGRAMERCGFVDLSEFLAWSAKQQTEKILATPKQED